MAGDRVIVKSGRDLSLSSLSDTETYKNDRKGGSLSLAFDGRGPSGIAGEADKGKTRSVYESVSTQSGIYGRKEGVLVSAGETLSMKGAVIGSLAGAEKNLVSAGELDIEDIRNHAEYTSENKGVGYSANREYDEAKGREKAYGWNGLSKEDANLLNENYNKEGIIPKLYTGAKGKASSVTRSAITEGTLSIADPKTDRERINRNTENSLNKLGRIFDKTKVEERQELARLFAKNVNEAIHKLSEKEGWKEGGAEKIALHSVFAGIEGELSGGGFLSGAAGGVNEALVGKLTRALGRNNPDLVQAASAVLGYATNKLAGQEGMAGAALAQYGTKWNNYGPRPWQDGAYIVDMYGNLWIVNDGEDQFVDPDEQMPGGAIFWMQNPEPGEQSFGWDYKYHDDGTADYIPGDVRTYGYNGRTVGESEVIDFSQGIVSEGFVYKVNQVLGKNLPLSQAGSFIYSTVKDGYIGNYSMKRMQERALFGVAASFGVSEAVGITLGQGPLTPGIIIFDTALAGGAGALLDNLKDRILPEESKQQIDTEDRESFNKILEGPD